MKIVLLGIMSRKPVAGVVWQTLQYLLGFRRLGYDVYYVEAHGCAPLMLMKQGDHDGGAAAAAFIVRTMRRFDLGDRWAFHALHSDGRCYGMNEGQLKQLYHSAALIINLHGGTQPLHERSATGRLIYLETDPVAMQVELHHNVQQAIDFLEPHCAYFTFGENYGRPDCTLPVSERFEFRPTRQPVLVDLWQPYGNSAGRTFSTVGSWRQLEREIEFRGEVYHWSKHYEFMKFLDLPGLTNEAFELALNRYDGDDERLLQSKGWSVRDALDVSIDPDAYRRYIAGSRGEFTVAKDQNVRFRTGWFSDRSATYLAAGRPVVTQETGFSDILPTGEGLFAFAGLEEAAQAIDSIGSDYERHRRAASALAREYFSYDVVLARLLAEVGLPSSVGTSQPATRVGEANDGVGAGWMATLGEDTNATRPGSDDLHRSSFGLRCSIVIPIYNNAALTRQCLDTLLRDAKETSFEIIVVDDASTDATQQLLERYGGRIRTVRHQTNRGFATACNAGAAAASGEYLVFLNNDVVPKTGWLDALVRYAESHPAAAAVGSKLLYPDSTVQHAGVVICQDLYPRHLYAGFPAEHPAVNRSRRFQIVTAASVLFRRKPFEEAGGFDAAYLNGFEDVDLCLRLGERGHEIHYCHESVGYHLEGVSEGRAKAEKENFRLYRERWNQSLRPDDVQYYLKDGLLGVGYARSYPIRLKASPLLAVVEGDERERQSDRLLNLRSLQVFELLKEIVRLTVRVQEAEMRAVTDERTGFHRRAQRNLDGGSVDTRHKIDALRRAIPQPVRLPGDSAAGAAPAPEDREEELRAMLFEAHWQLMRRDGEIEALAHDLQADLAVLLRRDAPGGGEEAGAPNGRFVPGKYLRYRRLVRRIWQVARTNLPAVATVVVVSRGDEALLELGDGRRGWHFPKGEGGVYAGHYPTDDAEAIAHLEELRAKGGEFLLLPETSLWWLEHYGGFREHLEEHYRPFVHEEGTCLIFDLREPPETEHRPTPLRIKDTGNVDHRDTPA